MAPFGLAATLILFMVVLMPVVWAIMKGRFLAAIAAFIIMILSSTFFGPPGYLMGFLIALVVVAISVSNHNQNRLIEALRSTVGKNSRVELRDHALIGTPQKTREQTIDITPSSSDSAGRTRQEPQIIAPFIEYWACPTCRGALVEASRFCSHCGVAVQWPKG